MSVRVSKSLAASLGEKLPKQAKGSRNKYGAVKTRFGDEVFDSRREANRWIELRRLQSLGTISDLERQVTYDLTVNGLRVCRMKPDFRYVRDGLVVVEDVKSMPTMTPVFRLKAKLLKAIHGVTLEVVL